MDKIKLFYNFIIFFIISFLFPQIIFADTVSSSAILNISANVIASPSSSPPSSGGYKILTSINFIGKTSPLSKVYLLKDGQLVSSVSANSVGNFSMSLINLPTNVYLFSLYSQDSNDEKSSSFSFPIYITSGSNVNIANIFLSPSIETSKSQVKIGHDLLISGQAIPYSLITISLNTNPESFYTTYTKSDGTYSYNLNTIDFDYILYQIRSRLLFQNQLSPFSPTISFSVGSEEQIKDEKEEGCFSVRGDLNCDGHIDLIDFSIMAYWYQRSNFPEIVDLNNDGSINLSDFSIMASFWTN